MISKDVPRFNICIRGYQSHESWSSYTLRATPPTRLPIEKVHGKHSGDSPWAHLGPGRWYSRTYLLLDSLLELFPLIKYRRFLRETVVATIKDHRSNKLVIAPPVGHLREVHHMIYRSTCPILTGYQVVEQGQITLLRSKSSTKNILTAGYRLVSVIRLPQMHETVLRPWIIQNGMIKSTAGPSLVNYFINTTITAFQSPEWNTIYER